MHPGVVVAKLTQFARGRRQRSRRRRRIHAEGDAANADLPGQRSARRRHAHPQRDRVDEIEDELVRLGADRIAIALEKLVTASVRRHEAQHAVDLARTEPLGYPAPLELLAGPAATEDGKPKLTVAFARAADRARATPPDALSLQLSVAELDQAAADLARRGVELVEPPRAYKPEFPGVRTAAARTPAGLSLRLWGGLP